MNVPAFNGGPGKHRSAAMLLEKAPEDIEGT